MNIDVNLDFNAIFEEVFSALAKAMNVAEETLLPIMVKQMVIEGITGLVVISCLLLSWLAILLFFLIAWRKADYYSKEGYLIGLGASFFVGVMILSIVLFGEDFLLDSITKTFNPEYAVIQEVVEMASDLVKGDD